MPIGPNALKLITMHMAAQAVPPDGGLADAINFLASPGGIGQAARKAQQFVEESITAVRLSAGLKYATWDDERIAALILQEVEARKAPW